LESEALDGLIDGTLLGSIDGSFEGSFDGSFDGLWFSVEEGFSFSLEELCTTEGIELD
jgi:hypothetical protein